MLQLLKYVKKITIVNLKFQKWQLLCKSNFNQAQEIVVWQNIYFVHLFIYFNM